MAASFVGRVPRPQALVGRRQFVVLGGVAAGMLALGELAPVARADSAAVPSNSTQTYTPGTYTATSRGKKAPLSVSVTFEEHSIASVEVTESGDTPRISAPAISTIPGQIVACQSLGVDSVSGATYTSLAIVNAVADCVDQAGGDSAALREAPGAEKSTETVEMDADLVVVGAGAAGMAAALEGALQGGKVAVFEKCAYIGGNALVSGGVLTYIDAPQELRQEVNDGYRNYFQQSLEEAAQIGVSQEHIDHVRQQWDEYYADGATTLFDSPEWQAICDLLASGAESVSEDDYQGTLAYAQSNLPLMEWLSQFEIPYSKLCSVVGYPWPDNVRTQEGECGEGWFAGFDDYISRTNPTIDFLFSTPATELIQGDDGTVTGVVGVCSDGTTYRVNAGRGVILATGGFSGSRELLEAYDDGWDFASKDVIPTTNNFGHTGDGLKMALAAGGVVEESNPNFMLLPMASAVDYTVDAVVGNSSNGLLVNAEGGRFVDESGDRNDICSAMMDQTDGMCYLLSDKNSCNIADGLTALGSDVEQAIAYGKVYRADTVAELAGQLGIDAQVLQDTVDAYNDAVRAGSDPEFGRTLFDDESFVVEPPFYAYPCTWAAHITNAGVSVDDDGAVVDESGAAIAGLYAAGEVAPTGGGIDVMAYGVATADAVMGA